MGQNHDSKSAVSSPDHYTKDVNTLNVQRYGKADKGAPGDTVPESLSDRQRSQKNDFFDTDHSDVEPESDFA